MIYNKIIYKIKLRLEKIRILLSTHSADSDIRLYYRILRHGGGFVLSRLSLCLKNRRARTFLAGDSIDKYPRYKSTATSAATVEMHEVRWYLPTWAAYKRGASTAGALFFFVLPRLVTRDYIAIVMNQRAAANLHCYL